MMAQDMLVGNIKKMVNLFKKNRKSFKKILKENIRIIGAGRTDKGVHASGQFANFKSIKKLTIKKNF